MNKLNIYKNATYLFKVLLESKGYKEFNNMLFQETPTAFIIFKMRHHSFQDAFFIEYGIFYKLNTKNKRPPSSSNKWHLTGDLGWLSNKYKKIKLTDGTASYNDMLEITDYIEVNLIPKLIYLTNMEYMKLHFNTEDTFAICKPPNMLTYDLLNSLFQK